MSTHKPIIEREKTLIGLPSRPETVESLFIVYHLTRHPQYREWGWNVFQFITNHCKVPSSGYSGIKNVNVTLEPHPCWCTRRCRRRGRGKGDSESRRGIRRYDGDVLLGTLVLNLIRVQRYSYFNRSAAERSLEIPLSPLLRRLRIIFDSKPNLMDRFCGVDCSNFSNAAIVFNTEACLPYLDIAFRALMNPSGRRVHYRSSTHPSGRGSQEKRRG